MAKQKTPQAVKNASQAAGLRKYSSLIIYIGLFLILTVGMLGLGSWQIQVAAHQDRITNLSQNQAAIIQQLSKNLMDMHLYLTDALDKQNANLQKQAAETGQPEKMHTKLLTSTLPFDAQNRLRDLQTLSNQFEANLNAFQNGGQVEDSLGGAQIIMNPLGNDFSAKANLDTYAGIWQMYRGLIDNLVKEQSKSNVLNRETTTFLVDYARNYTVPMLFEINKVTTGLREIQDAQTAWVEKVQLGAIVVAFILFGAIVFGALRQLVANDRQLAVANQEMSEIMASVNEGLFLVNKDLDIAGQYSANLEHILGQKDLGGKNLLDVLAEFVPADELDTTKVFIDQLYSDWVEVDLIEDLNPLHRISIQESNSNQLKFLDFKFFRVWLNNKIERVLVSVQDTTETVMLQASLEAQKEQEGRELEMLNIILNTNPATMNAFVSGSLKRLDDINRVLKTPENNRVELRSKAQYIAREIHSIKGEASSLKLHRMVDICETFEESLKSMRESPSLSGQDFLGLVVLLDDLYRLFDVLQNYNGRVNSDGATAVQPKSDEQQANEYATAQNDYLKNFVRDIAKRVGKKAELTISGFETSHASQEQLTKLKDIAIQILRNSVIHGIEMPDVRAQRNKPEIGSLKLTLTEQDGQLTLSAEDDGNGINFEAIRAKAVALGLATAEEAPNLDQHQLLNFMFSNGFSTAEKETEDAGRGVGMDIIKATIQQMGGKIGVSTKPESYTRFNMTFPAK